MNAGTITRRLEGAIKELSDEFKMLYDADDFRGKIDELIHAEKSKRPTVLAELFRMLDVYGIEYEQEKENEYYKNLIDEEVLPSLGDKTEYKMVYALYERYEKYAPPEEYMAQIVDKMPGNDGRWASDTLRVKILKRFIRDGKYLAGKYGGCGGRKYIRERFKAETGLDPTDENILRWRDTETFALDNLFDALEGANREDLKFSGQYGLLKNIDDIASGKFRTQGATKKFLYLFASVYGMTYKIISDDEPKSELSDEVFDSDIEKRLFRDYYANNLMRFIESEYKENPQSLELVPSGQGINYKNFAEVVYIYYIAHDLSPTEKLKRSYAMVNRLKKLQTDNSDKMSVDKRKAEWTSAVRNLYRNTDMLDSILKKSEEEFEKFVADHYNCKTYVEVPEKTRVYGGRLSVLPSCIASYVVSVRQTRGLPVG